MKNIIHIVAELTTAEQYLKDLERWINRRWSSPNHVKRVDSHKTAEGEFEIIAQLDERLEIHYWNGLELKWRPFTAYELIQKVAQPDSNMAVWVK